MMRRRPTDPATHALLAAVILCFLPAADTDAHPVSSAELSTPFEFSPEFSAGDQFMGVRLLGAVALRQMKIDGQLLSELSALAWDEDEQLLYALSDGGRLFHLKPEFDQGMLSGVAGVAGFPLRDSRGRRLRGTRADAEGLAVENAENGVRGDSIVYVVFERHPRLVRYATDGHFSGTLALPEPLAHVANYASANKSLESLTHHPVMGWLVAPERPLAGGKPGTIGLSSIQGKVWNYPLREVPNNSLTAIEALPDGTLVTLERGHGLMYLPFIVSVRRTEALRPEMSAPLNVSTAAVFDSSRGWRVDNFEGLARREGMKFFMVSDNNENAIQRTLLLQIELTDRVPKDHRIPEFDGIQKNRN